jgi:CheY-like chemotaxis protein
VATYRAGTKPRILCVEDEPGMCDLIRLILEAAGYAFLSAEDGAEVLLWKGKDPAIQDIPVIAVTALASPFDQIMWKQQTEIKDYVTKPFARKQLLDTIRRVLAGRADELEVASPAGT